MKMVSLNLDAFMASVKSVNAAISDQERYTEFLNEASSDTPIIAVPLEQLAVLESLPERKQKKTGLVAAHRDLVVLLALRHLEKAEDDAAN